MRNQQKKMFAVVLCCLTLALAFTVVYAADEFDPDEKYLGTIEIPGLGLSTYIAPVRYLEGDKTWDIMDLGMNIGLLDGTTLDPNGVSILVGHNHLRETANGPFLSISSLKINDRIFIRPKDGKLGVYSVYASEKIKDGSLESIRPYLKDRCTVLITCEEEQVDGTYAYRRVVFAELLSDN